MASETKPPGSVVFEDPGPQGLQSVSRWTLSRAACRRLARRSGERVVSFHLILEADAPRRRHAGSSSSRTWPTTSGSGPRAGGAGADCRGLPGVRRAAASAGRSADTGPLHRPTRRPARALEGWRGRRHGVPCDMGSDSLAPFMHDPPRGLWDQCGAAGRDPRRRTCRTCWWRAGLCASGSPSALQARGTETASARVVGDTAPEPLEWVAAVFLASGRQRRPCSCRGLARRAARRGTWQRGCARPASASSGRAGPRPRAASPRPAPRGGRGPRGGRRWSCAGCKRSCDPNTSNRRALSSALKHPRQTKDGALVDEADEGGIDLRQARVGNFSSGCVSHRSMWWMWWASSRWWLGEPPRAERPTPRLPRQDSDRMSERC